MTENKILDSDLTGKGVIGLNDVPSLNTADMQAKFDELVTDVVVPKHNSLIDDLASTDADKGADYVGFNAGNSELTATNVGAAIRETKTALDSAVLVAGNVPAGGTTGQVLSKNSNTDNDLKWETITDRLQFTDTAVATTAFVSDDTYEDFPYKASVTLTGVTADMTPEVVLGVTEAMSGSYAPVAECYAGGVYIYATEVPSVAITIPTIICWKAVE